MTRGKRSVSDEFNEERSIYKRLKEVRSVSGKSTSKKMKCVARRRDQWTRESVRRDALDCKETTQPMSPIGANWSGEADGAY